MKKLVFLMIMCFALISTTINAQSGWQQGNYYQYQGSIFWEPCSAVYPKFNNFGQRIGYFQCRRTTVWHQEWRQGYIYIWGPYGWETRWQQGNFWYFTWRTDEVLIGY